MPYFFLVSSALVAAAHGNLLARAVSTRGEPIHIITC